MKGINSLPTEIIATIFQLLFTEFELHRDKSINKAMRVCRLWRKIGTDLGFVADGKLWKFDRELCELRRVVPYDDSEAIWDPRVGHLKLCGVVVCG